MRFAERLIKGTIIDCHSNLLAEVELEDGEIYSVFCPNPDRVNKLYKKGADIWVIPTNNNVHKIHYEAILVENDKGLVMTNPNYISPLFIEAFEDGIISDFDEYDTIEELSSNGDETRLTFRLSNEEGKECYIYVCGIFNKENQYVMFPSFVDFREFTVYSELKNIRSQGIDTFFVILVIRTNYKGVKFCWSLDPVASAKAFDEAKNGLKFLCYGCNLDENEIEVSNKIDIKF